MSADRSAADLIGAGWAFPGRISPSGGIALDGGAASTDAAIRLILSTAPGERVMRPEFGCSLWEHVFAPMDAGTVSLAEKAVRSALERWEPRIEVTEVRATPEPEAGRLLIRISYLLRATNDQRNLVYPFYVIPGEEPGR
ncbi:MAG TPA: GPW/gp25 family protein [Kineosporiaceae bacterium]|nr:GPW/gp25 family protein [Kineosporiaceae bacterium]